MPDTYEVYEGVMYEWAGDVVKDVHYVRQMTEEECAAKDVELAERANALHQIRMERCQTIADDTEDATQKQLWLDCLAAHEAWVLESVDPITPSFPRFPIKDEAGNWGAP